jgi:hypothetical protein
MKYRKNEKWEKKKKKNLENENRKKFGVGWLNGWLNSWYHIQERLQMQLPGVIPKTIFGVLFIYSLIMDSCFRGILHKTS